MSYIIVSRHRAAVEYIREVLPHFKNVPVLEQATASDVRGVTVAGNLPLQLACLASSVYSVEFDGTPPRGQEYTVADMRAAGARIVQYKVFTMERFMEYTAVVTEVAQKNIMENFGP